MVSQQLLHRWPFLILMTGEMTVCVCVCVHAHVCFFFFPSVGDRNRPWPLGPLFVKTKQHQQYFFAWVGALIDVVATASYWSDYCYSGWRDWNWVSLLPCSHTHINTHTVKYRDGSYKIWQLQEGLLINLEYSSEGRVMAGEEEKEWLLPLNLYLSFSTTFFFSRPPSVSLSSSLLLFYVVHPLWLQSQTAETTSSPHFPLFLPLAFFPSLLVLHVWLLADMHTGSIAHLPNFSSSCLAPTPLLSSSFSLLSPAPCITISRHALREADEYFSSRRGGATILQSVFSSHTTLHCALGFCTALEHTVTSDSALFVLLRLDQNRNKEHWGWLDCVIHVVQDRITLQPL